MERKTEKNRNKNNKAGRFTRVFLLFIIHYSLFITPAFAQYYDVGEDPSWVKWRRIETKHFTLVYPSTLDSAAKRYAWLFDQASDKVAAPLETKLKRIPIVLHPYNLRSNGLVSWAPSRMELNTTPPHDGFPQLWDKQLVLHETRHAAQMSKMGDNIIKYLHWGIGEQAEGLFVGIFIPSWYLEGDATLSETALSSSGRGRYARFMMGQKAYLLDDMHFSWDQWKMGSYRYPVPNAYELGYTMSAYATLKAGSNIFGRALDYSTRRIYDIPPFDVALGKFAGGGEQTLQREAFEVLKKQWKQEDSLRGADIPSHAITALSTDYTAYNLPAVSDAGKIYALRMEMNRSPRLVEIDTCGEIKRLRAMTSVNSRLVYHEGFIFWTEIIPHPRWPQQSYSVIKCYNIATRSIYTLTHRTRYEGVQLSADGTRLVTIENTPEGESRLVIIPLIMVQGGAPRLSGNVSRYIPTPLSGVWKEAVWSTDSLTNTLIYATLLSDKGTELYSIDPLTRQYKQLIAPGFTDIKQMSWWNNQLLFVSGYNGRDNIYALQPGSRQIHRLSNARLGAFTPTITPDGAHMVYANYHAYGYQLRRVSTDSLLREPESFTRPYGYAWADSLSARSQFNLDTISVPPLAEMAYQSKPYNKLTHLFRFHSWAPLYINPDELKSMELDNVTNNVGWGATVFSQNSLNTAIARLGYHYNNGFHSGHLAFTYKGWWPVIDLKFDINDRYAVEYRDLRVVNDTLVGRKVNIKDPYIEGTIRLYAPLNFSSNGWLRALIPQIEEHFTNDRYYRFNDPDAYYYHYFMAGLTWYERLPIAARELYPRWGYMLKGQYLTAPFGRINIGHVGMVQLTTWTPGLFRNNGVQFKAGYQWQFVQSDGYYIQNLLPAPRGYPALGAKNMVALSADYSFPLFYPDWNLAWIAYFKRIRMNVFSDYSNISQFRGVTVNEWSLGFDILADYHIFRFDFPVETGIRCAFPMTNGASPNGTSPTISLLFSLKFN